MNIEGNTGSLGRTAATSVEAIGRRLIDAGFGADGSLLTPSRPIWTSTNLTILLDDFVNQPDPGAGTFFSKLDQQLSSTASDAVQLFAELFILNMLPIVNLNGQTKVDQAQKVLAKCDPAVSLPDDVEAALMGGGVYHGGQAFNNYRWKQLQYLIEVAQYTKSLPAADRNRALTDPIAFRELANAVPTGQAAQRQSLLYLAFPEFYLPIVSGAHRKQIRDSFIEYLNDAPGDIDQDLHDINEAIMAEIGHPVDYYLSPWKERWQLPPSLPKPEPVHFDHPIDDKEVSPVVDALNIPDATEELANGLHVDREWIQESVELLRDRPQLIFYGPPGTGKTYIAKELARHITGEDNVKIVQFHPAYSYEDFFEGYRPVGTANNQVAFELKAGPLRKIVAEAVEHPSAPYVLIIDEINRGNLAKIFGELYFLLEYRDETIDLLYSSPDGKPFVLPRNLFIIGTMNTADRSIALVDGAMRRRFAFVPLHPSEEPTRSLLRRWLEANGHPSQAADLLAALNARIADDDFKIGPSYFMRSAVHQPGGLERAWRTSILPLLEEHHYGHKAVNVEATYGLDAISAAAEAANSFEGIVPADGAAADHAN